MPARQSAGDMIRSVSYAANIVGGAALQLSYTAIWPLHSSCTADIARHCMSYGEGRHNNQQKYCINISLHHVSPCFCEARDSEEVAQKIAAAWHTGKRGKETKKKWGIPRPAVDSLASRPVGMRHVRVLSLSASTVGEATLAAVRYHFRGGIMML